MTSLGCTHMLTSPIRHCFWSAREQRLVRHRSSSQSCFWSGSGEKGCVADYRRIGRFSAEASNSHPLLIRLASVWDRRLLLGFKYKLKGFSEAKLFVSTLLITSTQSTKHLVGIIVDGVHPTCIDLCTGIKSAASNLHTTRVGTRLNQNPKTITMYTHVTYQSISYLEVSHLSSLTQHLCHVVYQVKPKCILGIDFLCNTNT